MSRFVLTAQLQLQAPNNVAQVVRQIQSQLNNVNVNLNVQGTAQAQRQLQQVTAQTQAAGTAADRMGRAFAISIRRFAAFSIATRAVGLFTSTLSDAVKSAIDFEREMVRVSQVTGQSISQLQFLTKAISDLATGFGVSSKDLLQTSQLLLQAGISAKDTEVALKTLAKAALAPNFDSLSETTEGAIAILAQFGEGVGALEKQLGAINAVAGAFAVEAGDLIDVIRRAGGVFKSSGGDLNELIALFTSVRATTRESAESIGTGLRTIFTRIQRPKTIEFLKQFGVELVDLEGKFVGPFEAVKRLSGALSGLGEGDITFIRIAEELGGFRQIGKVLPLLQQFSTAQAALNVANKSGNSLAQDAATAQQALAVRITKVKEEFLALVRGMTETKTFQIMANTALSLAEALIKIGEAIKPLLPLLAAVAAVNFAKGIGTFAGGLMRGMQSGRTYSTGGKVHHFARGGMVPGTGNRDTVPAMLQPGEFVIKKSSVNKLGAGNLAAMNENKYAIGGIVGGVALTPSDQTAKGSGKVSVADIIKALTTNSNLPGGIAGNKSIFEGVTSSKQAAQIIASVGGFGGTAPSSSRSFQAKGQSFKDADLDRQIGDDVELGMSTLIGNAATVLGSSIGVAVTGSPNANLIKSIGSADVMGKIFEGALNLLGAPFDPLAAKQDRDSFDFPSGLGSALGSYFKGFESIPVDAKKNLSTDILNDIATRKTKNLIAGQVNINPQFQALKQSKLSQQKLKKHFGGIIQGFATGGGVGTDTVPALLTPGEFVVNRSSAQSIGYGNLNRMNKVGKYAKGGVVQNFAAGGVTATPASSASRPSVVAYVSVQSLTQNAQALKANTQAVQQNVTAQNQQKKSVMDVVSNNKMFAASMGISLLQGFLPAVDENSGALLKLSHSFLGLLTTIASVGFALEAFGVSLKKQAVMQFFTGGGIGKRGLAGMRGGLMDMGLSKTFATQITGITQGIAKVAGPLIAVAGGAYLASEAFKQIAESIYNFDGRLKKAIEKGNVSQAQSVALEKATFEKGIGAGGQVLAATATGAAIGSFIPIIGTVIGGLVGLGVGLLSIIPNFDTTTESAVALAAAQAGAVKTQKELELAQKVATNAMEDFRSGAISASDALTKIRAATSEATRQEQRASDFASKNLENRSEVGSGAILRNLGAYLGGGLFGMETAATRNDRLGKESAQILRDAMKGAAQAFQIETEARTATIRSGFARGRSRSEIETQAIGDLRARRTELLTRAQRALRAGDTQSADAFNEAADQLNERIKQVEREMASLEKEVIRAKAAFDAMNLGLRGPEATATAMSASMDRFVAGLEVGGSTFLANTEFLSSAMSSAAQAMDPGDIKRAVDDVAKNLSDMGVDPAKFRANTEAFIQAQQNYNQAFDNIRQRIKGDDFTGMDADTLKKEFAKELTVGLGDDAKKNLTAIINGIELSEAEVDAILGGNLQVFGDKLGEAGQKQLEQIVKIAQERQKAEQVVISLINQRAEAERNLAAAQKEAINLYMEGRDVQAKYGGQAVTSEERLAAILARANAGAGGMGLRSLRTGNVGELRLRNAEILRAFSGVEARRSRDGGMQGREGADASNVQQDLAQAQKDQVQTIRDLIKFQEEELRIVQEKNKLEKESMESLITGDIEKFFEQQSTLGAQAAIATGDTQFANLFGADVLGKAFQNMQRQMEAGVQSLFGQQLVGPGGLVERAATTALASRGVTDPRAAQALAGTTAEEEALKRTLQDLGKVLGETGQVGAAMAEMQVQTAQINVARAELKLSEIEERGRRLAGGMSRGGMVYASRGMFVPRGTDTVPAMLTPGEFVVRREAVNRGNNLQLLRAINNGSGKTNGFAKGGKVGYYNNGGIVQYKALGDLVGKAIGIDSNMIANLGAVFNKFVSGFNESIKNLQNTKLQVKLDSVNVNVNLNSSSMLNEISQQAKQNIIGEVISKLIKEYGIGSDGKLEENKSSLPRPSIGS